MTMTATELGLLIAGISLGGVIVGALMAGLFTLVSGRLESERERARWLRDRRMETYGEYLNVLKQSVISAASGSVLAIDQDITSATSKLSLVGPVGVAEEAEEISTIMVKRFLGTNLPVPQRVTLLDEIGDKIALLAEHMSDELKAPTTVK